MHGEAHGVATVLPEPELQQVGHGTRHLHRADPGVPTGDQLGPGCVRGDRRRAGVGDAHRDAVHADGEAYAKGLDQAADRGNEALPMDVRLGALEQQEPHAGRIGDLVQDQAWVVVGLPVVLDEDHRRAARPVVQQLVDVEGRDGSVVERREQVVTGQRARLAGVDEPGQDVQQHRPGGRGSVRRAGAVRLLVWSCSS